MMVLITYDVDTTSLSGKELLKNVLITDGECKIQYLNVC